MPWKSKPVAERIKALVVIDPATECWIWQGALNRAGYGVMRIGSFTDETRRMVMAHRASFEAFTGPIADGLVLDHLCHVRACCNPAHLEAVTSGENTLRGNAPAAMNARKEMCKRGHPLSGANLYMNKGKRYCRVCLAVRHARTEPAPPWDVRLRLAQEWLQSRKDGSPNA